MRWVDARGRPSPHALRYAFLNAFFQTGLHSVLDAAILHEGVCV